MKKKKKQIFKKKKDKRKTAEEEEDKSTLKSSCCGINNKPNIKPTIVFGTWLVVIINYEEKVSLYCSSDSLFKRDCQITFTATFPQPGMTFTASSFSPIMTLVAIATKSCPRALDTKGNERDTLKLHSMTFKWLS